MRYILDTGVISELVRPKPSPSVVEWVRNQQEERLFLSVLTLGELRKGMERLTDGPRRRRLENWLAHDLKLRFTGRWLRLTKKWPNDGGSSPPRPPPAALFCRPSTA